MIPSTVFSAWTIPTVLIIIGAHIPINGLICWECTKPDSEYTLLAGSCDGNWNGYPIECNGACAQGTTSKFPYDPQKPLVWIDVRFCFSSDFNYTGLPCNVGAPTCHKSLVDRNWFEVINDVHKKAEFTVFVYVCKNEDYCNLPCKGQNTSCNGTVPEKADCRNITQPDRTPQENCQSCTTQPNCVFKSSGNKICLTKEQAMEDGLNFTDYHETPMQCIDDCNLYNQPNQSPQEICKLCTSNPKCVFKVACNKMCVPKTRVIAATHDVTDYYDNPAQCGETNKECHDVARQDFDIDSCFKCTNHSNCAFMLQAHRPRKCVEWNNAVVDSGKYIEYHRVPTECRIDCQLYIKKGSYMKNCVSCTRGNSNCTYLWRSKECWLKQTAIKRGFQANSDFYQQKDECLDDCDLYNQPEYSPQENCQLCFSNQKCVLKISGIKMCITRKKALEDKLNSTEYYEDPAQCTDDCGLAITPEQSAFEACVTCLQFRNPCKFHILKTGENYDCVKETSSQNSGGTIISDIRNCSSVCTGRLFIGSKMDMNEKLQASRDSKSPLRLEMKLEGKVTNF